MKKYSYVSLLTNDSYVYGIILISTNLKQVESKYPLHVLITKEVSTATREILNQLDNVTYEEVEVISLPEFIMESNRNIDPRLATTWENCWTKFRIFDQTQFDKIIFLDADIMILKNIDHLFECLHMTAALDGEYHNLWPNWPHFNAGCLVVEPSHDQFEDILKYGNSLTKDQIVDQVIADQELLNMYFNNWPNQSELHLNKYYNVFPPYVQEEELPDLQENVYFIHFVGRKPWQIWIKDPRETYSEYYYNLGYNQIVERIPSLDWQKIRKNLILSVYTICKNEKHNINKWFKSFGEADYICILDTGSTDGTWELLQEKKKEYPNLIISQQIISPWRFDTARNKSMELIPKETDIFFMVDLDEIIKEPGWCQLVKDQWEPNFSRGVYTYNRDVDKNDNILRAISEYRLHNKDWTHYINVVHENLCHKNGEKRFFANIATPIPITVWHYPDLSRNKHYVSLCEEQVRQYPNDDLARLQLAIEYEIAKKDEEAEEQYLYLMSNQNSLQTFELARCYTGLALILLKKEQFENVFFLCREARLICPVFVDAYVIEALVTFNQQNYEHSLQLILSALEICNDSFWCNIYDINTSFIYFLIGANYNNLGKKIEALGYLTLAHMLNPADQEISDNITKICEEKIQHQKEIKI